MSEEYIYSGEELVMFSKAVKWKKYFSQQIKPYIKGKVLEVGAGTGNNTSLLNDGSFPAWLLLEPDKQMAYILERSIQNKEYPANCRSKHGTIYSLDQQFDTIVYIDVLEHIEKDTDEISKAASLLNAGGRIIVLAPAFQSLYSPFDKIIGHYRRYNKKMLKAIMPEGLQLARCRYYDSMGYFASVANRLMLKQKYPRTSQVLFWDRVLVPLSKITDKIFFHSFGKSIIAIWEK